MFVMDGVWGMLRSEELVIYLLFLVYGVLVYGVELSRVFFNMYFIFRRMFEKELVVKDEFFLGFGDLGCFFINLWDFIGFYCY